MKTAGLDYLQRKISANSIGPFRLMCELTYACNFNCGHCYVPKKYRRIYASRELSSRQYLELFKSMSGSGVFFVGFTGGEPLVRKDFFKIIGSARKQGLQVIIYSNGSLIDKNKADGLAELNCNKIEITLPAFDDKIFEKITGVKGLTKVLKAIDLLLKRKVSLALKTCVLESNSEEISKITQFCAERKIEYKSDFFLAPRLDGTFPNVEGFSTGVRYKTGYREHPGSETCSETSSAIDSQVFPCGSGKTQCAVTPDGRLKACVQLAWPLVKAFDKNGQEKFLSAWNKLRSKTAEVVNNVKLPCVKCIFKAKCLWCPGYTWAKTQDFLPLGKTPECFMGIDS